MLRTQIKQGRRYAYKTHNSSGIFLVAEVYRESSVPRYRVVGFDKAKMRNITVFPSQVSLPAK